ncbi:MAG: glycine zipper domain-containing protein [Bacteroidales bacterium]|nr:glycine zipper domain-containing protein [Bacteroidales bacterium]
MKTAVNFLVVLVVWSVLTGCAGMPMKGVSGAGIGAGVGAIAGQAIGRNTEATLIGAAVGGLLGYIVGNEMDKFDRQQLGAVMEQGVSGQPVGWVNPDTGNRYQAIPQPAQFVQTPQGTVPCREAIIIAEIDGRPERTVARACRNPGGWWDLQ